MSDDNKILGDINPVGNEERVGPSESKLRREGVAEERQSGRGASAGGGSEEEETERAGSRDVTGGPTGGSGTEVGGTRNYRTGSGATGMDIGSRPE